MSNLLILDDVEGHHLLDRKLGANLSFPFSKENNSVQNNGILASYAPRTKEKSSLSLAFGGSKNWYSHFGQLFDSN